MFSIVVSSQAAPVSRWGQDKVHFAASVTGSISQSGHRQTWYMSQCQPMHLHYMSGRKAAMLEELETLLGDDRPFKAFSLLCSPALAGLECLFL